MRMLDIGRVPCTRGRDGCGRMFRYIESLYHGRPGVVVVSSDQADAYSHVDRQGAIRAGHTCLLEVEVAMRSLLSKESYHILQDHQWVKFLRQNNGFD